MDLADIGRALRARWKWVAGPTVLAFAGSLIFVNLVAPRYTGEAKLLLQAADTTFMRQGTDRGSDQLQIDEQAVASQVQVVMSRDLARSAIKQLGLVGNPEFDPHVAAPGLLQQIGSLVGLPKSQSDRPAEDRVLDKYYDHLLVYPVGKSRIVSIEFKSKDSDLAARAANTIAGLYLALQEDAKKDTARSASTWLGSNIDQLRNRVSDAENKVEAFRARTGLIVGNGTTTLSAQQLSELSGQLAQARTAQSDSQSKAKLIRDLMRDGRGFEIPDVANNELIRRLIEQRINLRTQLALEARTLLPAHPRMKELNAQLGDLEAQLRGAAERTVRTLENDSRIAGGRVEALERAIDAQKTVVATANEKEVQLRALERDARIERDQLESYLGRFREATARDTANAVPPDARIVSRAVAPQIPSFPKKTATVALVTFAMFVLALGTLVMRELLTSRPVPRRRADWDGDAAPRETVERAASPVQLAGPSAPTATVAPFVDPRYDFGRLVERLSQAPAGETGRRVLVTGVGGGAEAHDVARGLGFAVSQLGRAVVVLVNDDDLVEAGDMTLGFTDLVAGEAAFGDVIGRVAGSQLDLVTAGTLTSEALMADRAATTLALAALGRTYDWVLVALTSDRLGTLAPLLASASDAVVIASNLEPASKELVEVFETAQASGAKDVLVAREHALPGEIRAKAA